MKKIIILLILSLSMSMLSACMAKEYSGELTYSSKAKDELFGVEVDAPILIRTVEMVQKMNGDDGSELVLANKKLDMIEGEENPDYPEGLGSAIFYGPLKVGDHELSREIISELAYGELVEKVELLELPELNDTDYDLIKISNAYVSRSDDFELGDVKITYTYIEPCELKIKGQIKDGILNTNKIENVQLIEN